MDSDPPMSMPLLIALGGALLLGATGGLLTPIDHWYRDLRKPRLQPPNWLFGPAWATILGLAAWSAATAWTAAPDAAARTSILILFAAVAVFHTLWSPLFFRVQRPDWALIEILFLWGSLVALFIGLWPISHQASLLILPYLLWVSFATWLNSAIVRLNTPFGRAD